MIARFTDSSSVPVAADPAANVTPDTPAKPAARKLPAPFIMSDAIQSTRQRALDQIPEPSGNTRPVAPLPSHRRDHTSTSRHQWQGRCPACSSCSQWHGPPARAPRDSKTCNSHTSRASARASGHGSFHGPGGDTSSYDLDLAFHPSAHTDLSRTLEKIQPVQITLEPTTAAIPPTLPADPQEKIYAEAVRLEKARAITLAMCTDKQGNLWCATEGNGVQVWNPNKPPLESLDRVHHQKRSPFWTTGATPSPAIPSAVSGSAPLTTACACFNGTKWQTYEVLAGLSSPDTLNGPIGSRIFKIVVNPKDGDVSSATEWGLCRYSQSKNTWTYYTKAEGLPSDQANSMAFDSEGNIYVATQCDGIAMANTSDNYKTWRTVVGPNDEPTTPTGAGLPSNLMNDILVSKDGTVYAATDAGLAWSLDKGRNWRYVRGGNYAKKIRLAVGGPPKGWAEQPGAFLAEDYCTCLLDAGSNGIWLGHRETAAEVVDVKNSNSTPAGPAMYSQCSSIAANHIVFGTCADNLASLASLPASLSPLPQSPIAAAPTPAGAALPTDLELANYPEKVAAATQPAFNGGFYFGEDWNTGGDWVAIYGHSLPLSTPFGRRAMTFL